MSTIDLTPASYGTAQQGESSRPQGSAARRVLGMARANAVLLVRNRMTFVYAVVMPLVPLALLLAGPRGEAGTGVSALTNVLMLAAIFPVYYNLLSLTVTRRDELVLKRLRTGEATDREILASMALPGVAVLLAVVAISVPVAAALGQPLPHNGVVVALAAVLVAGAFAALAFWTAAWTKNAEAAQLTSMPVILVAVVGSLVAILPERVQPVLEWTPGAALDALVRIGWFGQDAEGAAVSFTDSFAASAQPLVTLAVWAVVAASLAARSMRWEPRG